MDEDNLGAKGERLTRQLPDPDSIQAAQERELELTRRAMSAYILEQMEPSNDTVTVEEEEEVDPDETNTESPNKPLVSQSVTRHKPKSRIPKSHG